MLLLFDAGNTRLKWAVANADDALLETGVIDYASLQSGIAELGARFSITCVAISSVIEAERNQCLDDLCWQHCGQRPMFARVSKEACGVSNTYRAQERLGVDRWVAAMGVSDAPGVNRVIVDAGTAVTIDLVTADNAFAGGVILPGAKLMHDSLVGETVGIDSQRGRVSSVIGKTTDECVNAGASYGLVGAIDRVISEMAASQSSKKPWRVYLCGGDADWLSELMRIDLPISLAPNMLFTGLVNLVKRGGLR